MSQEERTGNRSLLYSRWHRVSNLWPVLGAVAAAKLGMIDIDACEYCRVCNIPVALIETIESTGPPKQAPVMAALARLAGVRAFSVSIAVEDGTISAFQVRELNIPAAWNQVMSPEEYAHWLLSLRATHTCGLSRSPDEA